MLRGQNVAIEYCGERITARIGMSAEGVGVWPKSDIQVDATDVRFRG
jgi:hypothetical protein